MNKWKEEDQVVRNRKHGTVLAVAGRGEVVVKFDDGSTDRYLEHGLDKEEIWKSIPGHPGYEASSLGSIRSIDRKVWVEQKHRSYWKAVRGRKLSIQMDKDGYQKVSLMVDGKSTPRRVSRLVCEAFHGSCPKGLECLHGPAGKGNDSIGNVSWGTKSQNEKDKYRDGVSNHKPVLRSDGKKFIGVDEAAKSVSGSCGYLSDKLNNKHSTKWAYGFKWTFAEDISWGPKSIYRKKVRRSDGKIFDSITEGAIASGGLQPGVSTAIKSGKEYKGYRWEFV